MFVWSERVRLPMHCAMSAGIRSLWAAPWVVKHVPFIRWAQVESSRAFCNTVRNSGHRKSKRLYIRSASGYVVGEGARSKPPQRRQHHCDITGHDPLNNLFASWVRPADLELFSCATTRDIGLVASFELGVNWARSLDRPG